MYIIERPCYLTTRDFLEKEISQILFTSKEQDVRFWETSQERLKDRDD